MAKRVILVGHANDEFDDRLTVWAKANGYDADWHYPYEGDTLPEIDEKVAGVVVYGGRFDVDPKDANPFLRDETRLIEDALKRDLPLLGFCLGGQLIADVLGSPVGPHPDGYAEYGYYPLIISDEGREVFGEDLMVLESHWHGWFDLPSGAVHLAASEHFPQQAFRYGNNAYALQFHPEASYSMMSRWAGRRSGERHAMPGAFSVERQLADHALYDEALGAWFNTFLNDWMAGSIAARQAAE